MGFIDFRENNIYTVYIHIIPKSITNYNFDKYYVGITSLDVSKRWGKDGINYQNITFGKAIKKYGWNNIEHEIFAENLTEKEASDMEIMLIDLLKSTVKNNGYNVRPGGNVARGFKVSDETKLKISISNTGKKRTPEMIETIRKNTPKREYEDCTNIKKIYRFLEDGEFVDCFSCARRASDYLGISKKGILKCARKSGSVYKEFQWEFEENVIKENNTIIPKNKPIDNYIYKFTEDGKFVEKYKTIVSAAIANNLCQTYLGVMISKHEVYKNFIFCKYDNIIKKDGELYLKEFFKKQKQEKEVYQFTTNGEFVAKHESVLLANKSFGSGYNAISHVALRKPNYNTAGGFIWRYEKDVSFVDGAYIITDTEET